MRRTEITVTREDGTRLRLVYVTFTYLGREIHKYIRTEDGQDVVRTVDGEFEILATGEKLRPD